jgi:flagellar M-ring protein FliF
MDARARLSQLVAGLPVAHRIVIASAVAALLMGSVVFFRWVTAPTFTVLYSGMDDKGVAAVIDGLESAGVPYRLEGGGSRILVPRERLYETRAQLAAAGVSGSTAPPGYELLDEQGLSVSDFRQRVDYKRALEGELAKTLAAMDGVTNATVHLVMPERELFEEQQEDVTASVLLDTTRQLTAGEVETVTFLTTSAVEGLGADGVTVADTKGNVLHAPGDSSVAGSSTNRNLRQTREFEQALADDITRLLARTGGGPASVVVRATLNYDEAETQTERYDPDRTVTLREQTSAENYEGSAPPVGGAVGVDGGPLGADGTESTYDKDEAVREFGVDKTTQRVLTAPGAVEKLSVAIVTDDGTRTGVNVPRVADVENLVAAAVGLDAERGDTIAVTRVSYPPAEDAAPADEGGALLDLVVQVIAVLVLLLVSVALLLMTRRRRKAGSELEWVPSSVEVAREPEPEPSAAEAVEAPERPAAVPAGNMAADLTSLVQRQPEEIATLLRSWLADRRS